MKQIIVIPKKTALTSEVNVRSDAISMSTRLKQIELGGRSFESNCIYDCLYCPEVECRDNKCEPASKSKNYFKKQPFSFLMVELMAPCADWSTLTAAVKAGADSVYFGTKELNMRATAKNFEVDELGKIVKFCHEYNVGAYLTVNTIIYEDESVDDLLKKAKKAGIDAIICWDFSVIEQCRGLGLPIYISTQASVANSRAANFYKKLGAKRVVLARECTLDQIRKIRKKTNIEIEAFVHGAMCISISGRCFTSQFLYNKSANRGECIQPCRRQYLVRDIEEDKELVLENNYVMSAKDLCAMPFLDELIDAGIDAFKIEGRTKTAEYVKIAVQSYREAIDAYKKGKLDKNMKDRLCKKLRTIYNRGFSDGFYFGKPGGFVRQYGSIATKVKVYAGKIVNFYKEVGVANIKVEGQTIKKGDEIAVIGPTTGCIIQNVDSMEIDNQPVEKAEKGKNVGIKLNELARENDRVYILKESKAVVH